MTENSYHDFSDRFLGYNFGTDSRNFRRRGDSDSRTGAVDKGMLGEWMLGEWMLCECILWKRMLCGLLHSQMGAGKP